MSITNQTIAAEPVVVLGELSRGICHDLKNFLTAIQGNAEMARRTGTSGEEPLERSLEKITEAALAASDLCNQVLAYSRQGALPRSVFNFSKLVERTALMLHDASQTNIKVTVKTDGPDAIVEASESQIRQIVSNLIANAFHAVGEKGGTVTLTVSASKESGTAELEVSDTGPGIAFEKQTQLFEPTFTTKAFGVGNGLGLMLVKRIAEEHGGAVSCKSEPGKGCSFQVTIPLTDKVIVESPQDDKSASSLHRKYNVLLVDDEEFMRSLGIDILQSLGYRVTVASTGREAFELIQKNPDYFDVILSDSRMPEMSGEELALETRKIRPNLPFILVTAFASIDGERRTKKCGIHGIVAKPFLIEDLKKALDQALSQREKDLTPC
ncbi:hybrid sensor histidine kinase/response regulator [Rubellicoccus peritrichatus]|uniref:histidine kinase n=1 Tax=Rubellicoccus peritrichatus TaxID=3080537 RepID=A0AAQ3LG97_9BACT|nr:ATP-binding protein [Puniceicoccus sp. CR14]WOO41599.1 ATP-binding protein [Puniceicoccus sp. CR14]